MDSKERLKAKDDVQALSKHNQFLEFEQELQYFLVNEQGKVMIENPCHKVLRRLASLGEQITLTKDLSNAQLEDLSKRKEELQDLINRNKKRKELLIAEIDQVIREIRIEAREEFRLFVSEALLQIEATVYTTNLEVTGINRFVQSRLVGMVSQQFETIVRPKIDQQMEKIRGLAERDIEITNLQVDQFLAGFSLQNETNDSMVPTHYNKSKELSQLQLSSCLGVILVTGAILSGLPALIIGAVGASYVYNYFEEHVAPNEIKSRVMDWWRGKHYSIVQQLEELLTSHLEQIYEKLLEQILPMLDSHLQETTNALQRVENLHDKTRDEQREEITRLHAIEDVIADADQRISEILTRHGGI